MATRITENYDSYDKADIQAESDARGLTVIGTGASGAVVKSDIVAALEDNDTESGQPKPPLPPLKASPIPQVKSLPDAETVVDVNELPPDEDFTDGVFVNKEDGEEYALCIHEKDGYQRTHSLKNSRHTWQGNEAEFDATFKKS